MNEVKKTKQMITLYVDADLMNLAGVRDLVAKRIFSQFVEKLISQYFALEDRELPKEVELVEIISKLDKVINDAQKQMSEYTVMLSEVRKDKGE
jgi:xylose isomerase